MKLAEALTQRKSIKETAEILTRRAQEDILVEKGDMPAEDVASILNQIDTTLESFIELSYKINRANLENKLEDKPLYYWILKRDALILKHALYQRILDETSRRDSWGGGKSERKIVSTYSIKALRKKIDHIAKQVREIDAKIQYKNWQIEI